MLRPNKGEGERSTYSLIKKGSQIFFVTLIFAIPVCMAESARADYLTSTSGFSSIGGRQSLVSVQTQTASQFLYQSRNYSSLGGKQYPFKLILPTLSDLDTLKSTLSSYKNQLASLKSTPPTNPENAQRLAVLISDVEASISNLSALVIQAEKAYNSYVSATETFRLTTAYYNAKLQAEQEALDEYNTASSNYTEVANAYNIAKESFDASVTRLQTATQAKEEAQSAYDIADASLTAQTNVINQRLTALNEAKSEQSLAEQNLITAQQEFNEANNNVSVKFSEKQQAYQNLQQAQQNYDTNLIPDPSWIAPTQQVPHTRQVAHTREIPVYTQVPHTTTTVTGGLTATTYNRNGYNNAPPMPTANETPLSTQTVTQVDFQWGSGGVLNSGRSEDVIVKFTGYIQVQTSNYYHFYAPADDGTRLYIDNQLLIDDWYDKGGGGSTSQAVYLTAGQAVPITLYYYENGGGAAVSLQYYTYDAPYYQIAPAAWFGTQTSTTTTYTTEVSYVTETYYTEETYYTTEPVTEVQKTLQVDIREGGQATFNAPAGSTFVSSYLRYEAINNPSCGAFIYPQVNGLSSVTLRVLNSVYGDPCGGQVKHITGTLTYLGAPTAPLIKNPALLAPIEEAQNLYDVASQQYDTALSNKQTIAILLNSAESAVSESASSVDVAQSSYNSAVVAKENASPEFKTATDNLATANAEFDEAVSAKSLASTNLETATTNEQDASAIKTAKLQTYTDAQSVTQDAYVAKQEAEAKQVSSESVAQESFTKATVKSRSISLSEVKTLHEEPAPEPEKPSKELPAEITAESILATDLTQIDPTTMSEAQAEQLKEAALVIFETAVEGSAEYEQALDALYLAAEQDDIVLDPALASIPGLQAATELVNFFGNAGADMSPKKREESKKIVVSAVVAAGTAIQSAAAAASTASASSSSGGSRRTGK